MHATTFNPLELVVHLQGRCVSFVVVAWLNYSANWRPGAKQQPMYSTGQGQVEAPFAMQQQEISVASNEKLKAYLADGDNGTDTNIKYADGAGPYVPGSK